MPKSNNSERVIKSEDLETEKKTSILNISHISTYGVILLVSVIVVKSLST